MEIHLFNTLSKQKELFKSITPNEVRMYNCGPTVYNYAHIGNLRSYVFASILRKTLEYNGYTVTQVINITDIGHLTSDADEGEDKMTTALKKEGKPLTLQALKEHADFFANAFKDDLIKMNIQLPEFMPKASDHVPEDIALVQTLMDKGFAYVISNGVYFDISKDPDYGKLGGIVIEEEEQQSRIGHNQEKRNPQDFCLWKLDSTIGWDSPWGKGFPGWHIECSAMSMKYLGETFDIHTGGMDHIPVHHNNEIAQSESATGKPFAHYWLHGAFINVSGEKISKSLYNDVYISDLIKKGISPLAYRYLLLTAHYSTPMNFTWDALEGASQALKRLQVFISETPGNGTRNESYIQQFVLFINNNLDTPKAIALIWELLKNANISNPDKKATILSFDNVLGLDLSAASGKKEVAIPLEIQRMVIEREVARKSKDWAKSDELRAEIMAAGFDIKDTEFGPQVSALPF
jgi:cysteinyl-tRNA synthetase